MPNGNGHGTLPDAEQLAIEALEQRKAELDRQIEYYRAIMHKREMQRSWRAKRNVATAVEPHLTPTKPKRVVTPKALAAMRANAALMRERKAANDAARQKPSGAWMKTPKGKKILAANAKKARAALKKKVAAEKQTQQEASV